MENIFTCLIGLPILGHSPSGQFGVEALERFATQEIFGFESDGQLISICIDFDILFCAILGHCAPYFYFVGTLLPKV